MTVNEIMASDWTFELYLRCLTVIRLHNLKLVNDKMERLLTTICKKFNSWPFAQSFIKLSYKRIDSISFSVFHLICNLHAPIQYQIGMLDRQYLFLTIKITLICPQNRSVYVMHGMRQKWWEKNTGEHCLINLCEKGTNWCCTDYHSLWMSYFLWLVFFLVFFFFNWFIDNIKMQCS